MLSHPDSCHRQLSTPFPWWATLCRQAVAAGRELYLVGGSVRDLLLQRSLADLDFACRPRDLEFWTTAMAELLAGHFFTMGKEELITRRLVRENLVVDLTPLAGATILQDLEHRDFTCNAMACGLHDHSFLDPFAGRQALEQRQIICVSHQNLLQDPLRVLRAARFALELDCSLPPDTGRAMAAAGSRLATVAGERIGIELGHIMNHPRAHHGLRLLLDNQALLPLFPPLGALAGLVQNEYHHLDVLQHTLLTLEKLDALLAAAPPADIDLQPEDRAVTRWAALFHDLGKAMTRSVDPETGRVHFYGHERFSAHLAGELLAPLGLGKQFTRRVVTLIEQHLAPLLLTFGEPRPKALRKLVFALGDDLPLLLLLAQADTEAAGGRDFARRRREMKTIREKLLEIYSQERASFIRPLVNGKDLLALGLAPGPAIGRIIRTIHQLQIDGECRDREEALIIARELAAAAIPPAD